MGDREFESAFPRQEAGVSSASEATLVNRRFSRNVTVVLWNATTRQLRPSFPLNTRSYDELDGAPDAQYVAVH